jgi:hypothetical protein
MCTLKYKEVKIKKNRRCFGCGFIIDAGKIMHYIVSIFEGNFGATYWCEVCEAYLSSPDTDFSDGVAEYEFRYEDEYNEFKKDYLCKTRQVLIEKFTNINPCKKIQYELRQ